MSLGTAAGAGSEVEQKARPAPSMPGGHAYEDNQVGAVGHTLESGGDVWSLLHQAARLCRNSHFIVPVFTFNL